MSIRPCWQWPRRSLWPLEDLGRENFLFCVSEIDPNGRSKYTLDAWRIQTDLGRQRRSSVVRICGFFPQLLLNFAPIGKYHGDCPQPERPMSEID
jgi:hypothetical protein